MDGRFPQVPEGGFQNREDFRVWLEGHDEYSRLAISPVLAVRSALRAIVFVESALSTTSVSARFALSICRALAVAWTAAKHPNTANVDATKAAADASSALWEFVSRNKATGAAADAAITAARSVTADSALADVDAAVRASNAAELSAIAAAAASDPAADKGEEEWRAITADSAEAGQIGSPAKLLDRPVWLSGTPEWWTEHFERFEQKMRGQSGNEAGRAGWEVWIGWLQCRVQGKPSWQLSDDNARKIEERIALGDGRAEFWDREPDAINAEILGWLSLPDLYDKPERKERPAVKTEPATKAPPSPKTIRGRRAKTGDKFGEATITTTPPPPIIQPPTPTLPSKRADLEPLADTVDGSVDHLGRANIAYALAGRINEVWDQMNKPGTGPQGAAPGFVIHIDAPWGGGKSTFAEYVAQILNPYVIKGPLPAWLKALPIGKDGTWPERFRRPWHIVRFNAWQHQHVSPPWWVFYETIRETVTRQGAQETNRQEAVLPAPIAKFAFADWYDRFPGKAASWLTESVWRFATPGNLINAAFLVAVVLALWMLTHMGLATFDLEKGISRGGAGVTAAGSEETGLGLIPTLLVTLFGGGAAVWKIVSSLSSSLVPGTPDAAKNYSLGSGDPLKRMRKHFVELLEAVHRPVLVIVDDLDRCEPAFVVELVRGMQTILASPRVVYLLLGDRDWIEQSFTEVHKAMKGVEVGPEHRFGGRFVEKAIQFSMVLPDVSHDGKQAYVKQLLTSAGKPVTVEPVTAPPSVLENAVVPEGQKQTMESLKADTKEVLETNDYQERERKAKVLADKYDLDQMAVPKAEFEQEMAQKLFFRAVTDSTAERATSHMIEGMASILPANPRQIKRIINTLSLLGQVLRIKDPARRPGSADWQLLARWVVLMVEWPKSWFTLSRHPGLADMALGILQGKSEGEIAGIETRMQGLGFLPVSGSRPLAKLIAANPTVMRALDFLESDWVHKPIMAEQIKWLREVMPAASGQVLQPPQQEKPASSDPPAAPGKTA